MRNTLLRIDWWLLLPVIVLVTLGLTTIFSVNPAFFRNQLAALFVSIVVFFFFSQVHVVSLKRLALPIYMASLIALVVVLIIGFESRGAVRWIDVFGVSIQFSEIAKPLLSVCLASFIARHDKKSAKTYFSVMLLLIPVALLIYLQPDLGNALIYVGATMLTLIIFGFPLIWFLLSGLLVMASAPFIWQVLHGYQRQRVMTFLNPTGDPLGTSYNLIQAIIAVGSGSLFGKGLSEGTQSGLRFLPERHTDFIFATLTEGLGFIGSVIVILCFVILLYRIIVIYKHANDPFSKVLAITAFCLIIIQFFVNIGMNVGVFPIVGVTLPFVSFGGSSLLANFMLLGMLSSLSSNDRTKSVLEIR